MDTQLFFPDGGHSLLQAVESGSFWTLSDSAILHLLKEEFPAELEYLKHAYSVRGQGWEETPNSPSKILFSDEDCHDEINRSLVGVLALRWINDDDYEKFVGGQPSPVKLRRESFRWIRSVFDKHGIIDSREYKLYVLITSMVANDLGKSTSFVREYGKATGQDIAHENHDMILHRAVQKGLVSAIERLRPPYRDNVKRGIQLGAEFNVGQLAQAENAPASLVPLLSLVGHEDAWNIRWMEQLLDIAGAAGHENHNCAEKLIEPIFQSYRSVYDIVVGIAQGKLTLRSGYDQNLRTRYQLITDSGWKPKRDLNVENPEDRTIMRIFCMGNVADSPLADLYFDTFYSDLISDDVRQQLVEHMNRDGTVDEPAIQPTYGPGMMNLALTNLDKAQKADTNDNDGSDAKSVNAQKQKIIAAMLRYLGRVFALPPRPDIVAEGNVTVIERDCRVAIKHVVESAEFLVHPEILDEAPLPADSVANRVAADRGK